MNYTTTIKALLIYKYYHHYENREQNGENDMYEYELPTYMTTSLRSSVINKYTTIASNKKI